MALVRKPYILGQSRGKPEALFFGPSCFVHMNSEITNINTAEKRMNDKNGHSDGPTLICRLESTVFKQLLHYSVVLSVHREIAPILVIVIVFQRVQ